MLYKYFYAWSWTTLVALQAIARNPSRENWEAATSTSVQFPVAHARTVWLKSRAWHTDPKVQDSNHVNFVKTLTSQVSWNACQYCTSIEIFHQINHKRNNWNRPHFEWNLFLIFLDCCLCNPPQRKKSVVKMNEYMRRNW